MDQLHAVVLAAGEGKRMHSKLPKVLHPLCGRPMIEYILESADALTSEVTIVVGHGASHVKEALGNRWGYVLQEEQLGTGHAVMQAVEHLPGQGRLLVLCGDTPLLKASEIKQLVEKQENLAAAVATTIMPDPAGYGRILRDESGYLKEIVEDKDASSETKKIDEINTGTYCFDLVLLKHFLPLLKTDNVQQEYYLTDVLSLMREEGKVTAIHTVTDSRVGLGINNRVQLANAEEILRRRINTSLMESGVTLVDPENTYIDYNVQVGKDTLILPGTVIQQGTIIGSDCIIGPNSHLISAVIKDRAVIHSSVIKNKTIGEGKIIGPHQSEV